MKKIVSPLLLVLLCLDSLAQSATYDIYAVEFDRGDWHPIVSDIAVGSSRKDTINLNFVIWLLQGKGGTNIIVDAGFTTTTPGKSYQRPDSALQKMNIAAEDISDIILTHPHWDHIGGIDLFPKAKVWLQEADYTYFISGDWKNGKMKNGFNENDITKLKDKDRMGLLKLVRGDSIEILPGIRVFIGSKHTFESQYVMVNGSSGKTIIASDNSWFYANLEEERPIPTYVFDADAYAFQLKRMKMLVDDTRLIIPGHDAQVFSNFKVIVPGVVKIELDKK